MIMGYSMYRNLSQCYRVRSKTQKKIFQEALVDPGTDNFSLKGFAKSVKVTYLRSIQGKQNENLRWNLSPGALVLN